MSDRKQFGNHFVDAPRQGWAFFEESGRWRRLPSPSGAPADYFPEEFGDWVAVAKPADWTPSGTLAGSFLLDDGAGGGMKIGAGHKPQPYDWHGRYASSSAGAGGGAAPQSQPGAVLSAVEADGKRAGADSESGRREESTEEPRGLLSATPEQLEKIASGTARRCAWARKAQKQPSPAPATNWPATRNCRGAWSSARRRVPPKSLTGNSL